MPTDLELGVCHGTHQQFPSLCQLFCPRSICVSVCVFPCILHFDESLSLCQCVCVCVYLLCIYILPSNLATYTQHTIPSNKWSAHFPLQLIRVPFHLDCALLPWHYSNFILNAQNVPATHSNCQHYFACIFKAFLPRTHILFLHFTPKVTLPLIYFTLCW